MTENSDFNVHIPSIVEARFYGGPFHGKGVSVNLKNSDVTLVRPRDPDSLRESSPMEISAQRGHYRPIAGVYIWDGWEGEEQAIKRYNQKISVPRYINPFSVIGGEIANISQKLDKDPLDANTILIRESISFAYVYTKYCYDFYNISFLTTEIDDGKST